MPYNFICVQTGSILSQINSMNDVFTIKTFISFLFIAIVFAVPTILNKRRNEEKNSITIHDVCGQQNNDDHHHHHYGSKLKSNWELIKSCRKQWANILNWIELSMFDDDQYDDDDDDEQNYTDRQTRTQTSIQSDKDNEDSFLKEILNKKKIIYFSLPILLLSFLCPYSVSIHKQTNIQV